MGLVVTESIIRTNNRDGLLSVLDKITLSLPELGLELRVVQLSIVTTKIAKVSAISQLA